MRRETDDTVFITASAYALLISSAALGVYTLNFFATRIVGPLLFHINKLLIPCNDMCTHSEDSASYDMTGRIVTAFMLMYATQKVYPFAAAIIKESLPAIVVTMGTEETKADIPHKLAQTAETTPHRHMDLFRHDVSQQRAMHSDSPPPVSATRPPSPAVS